MACAGYAQVKTVGDALLPGIVGDLARHVILNGRQAAAIGDRQCQFRIGELMHQLAESDLFFTGPMPDTGP
jgi:hypothetical protein